jgi:hypothetical protein
MDYDAIQSLVITMYPSALNVTSSQARFYVLLTMVSEKPAFEDTQIIRTTISLDVDSIPAGRAVVPFNMRVGGWAYGDIAYGATFNMTGTDAQTVAMHSQHVYLMTVHFLAMNSLYQEEITRNQTMTR